MLALTITPLALTPRRPCISDLRKVVGWGTTGTYTLAERISPLGMHALAYGSLHSEGLHSRPTGFGSRDALT